MYLINYDNGVDDCGTFPWEYATSEKAEAEAEDIAAEMIADGIWSEEGGCEVIEMGRTDEPLAHTIEGTFDHFDRYIG